MTQTWAGCDIICWCSEGATRVGHLVVRYPEVLLTEGQVRPIDEAIVNLVMEQDLDLPVLKFNRRELANGALVVTCCEGADCEWLVRNVRLLSLSSGVSLKALKPDELPQRAMFGLFVKSQKDPKDILRILGRFNPSLHVNSWILNERIRETRQGDALLFVSVPRNDSCASPSSYGGGEV